MSKPAAKKRQPSKSRTSGAEKKASDPASAARLIDERIAELADWRGRTLASVRTIINNAAPGIVEEWKWSVPVWSCGGIICTGETYKKAVKLTFAKGASLPDPSSLFNSSLAGGTRRAIDLHEGAAIDEQALKALVRAAVALNTPDADLPTRGRARGKPPTPLASRKKQQKH